jgi:hypothetical protein
MKKAGFKYFISLPDMSDIPIPKGKWLRPEKHTVPGQHDALFYRQISPKLAALIQPE